jgi:hypothetical protein
MYMPIQVTIYYEKMKVSSPREDAPLSTIVEKTLDRVIDKRPKMITVEIRGC